MVKNSVRNFYLALKFRSLGAVVLLSTVSFLSACKSQTSLSGGLGVLISPVSGNGQICQSQQICPTSLTAQVYDSTTLTPIPGVTINFAVASTTGTTDKTDVPVFSGTLSSKESGVTDNNGYTSVRVLAAKTFGAKYTISATAQGSTSAGATFTLSTVSGSVPTQFSAQTTHNGVETAGVPFGFVLELLDAQGNLSTVDTTMSVNWTYTVSSSWSGVAPTIPTLTSCTFVQGICKTVETFIFTDTLNPSAFWVGNNASGLKGVTSQTITVNPNTAANVVVASGLGGPTANATVINTSKLIAANHAALNFYAALTDVGGNYLRDATSATWSASNESISGVITNGIGTTTANSVKFTPGLAGTGNLLASSSGLTSSIAPLTIYPGPPDHLIVVSDNASSQLTASPNQAFNFHLLAVDANGNQLTGQLGSTEYSGLTATTWSWTNNTPKDGSNIPTHKASNIICDLLRFAIAPTTSGSSNSICLLGNFGQLDQPDAATLATYIDGQAYEQTPTSGGSNTNIYFYKGSTVNSIAQYFTLWANQVGNYTVQFNTAGGNGLTSLATGPVTITVPSGSADHVNFRMGPTANDWYWGSTRLIKANGTSTLLATSPLFQAGASPTVFYPALEDAGGNWISNPSVSLSGDTGYTAGTSSGHNIVTFTPTSIGFRTTTLTASSISTLLGLTVTPSVPASMSLYLLDANNYVSANNAGIPGPLPSTSPNTYTVLADHTYFIGATFQDQFGNSTLPYSVGAGDTFNFTTVSLASPSPIPLAPDGSANSLPNGITLLSSGNPGAPYSFHPLWAGPYSLPGAGSTAIISATLARWGGISTGPSPLSMTAATGSIMNTQLEPSPTPSYGAVLTNLTLPASTNPYNFYAYGYDAHQNPSTTGIYFTYSTPSNVFLSNVSGNSAALTSLLIGTETITPNIAGAPSPIPLSITFTPGAYSKLGILHSNPSSPVGVCYSQTIYSQDANGFNTTNHSANSGVISLNVSTDFSSYTFYTGNNCVGGNAIASNTPLTLSIANGSQSVSFSYLISVGGLSNLYVNDVSTGSSVSTKTFQHGSGADRLVMSDYSGNSNTTYGQTHLLYSGTCAKVIIQFNDDSGNQANLTTSKTFNVTSTPSTNVNFYSDSACNTQLPSNRILSVSSGNPSATFYYKPINTNTLTISAADQTAPYLTPSTVTSSPLPVWPNNIYVTPATKSIASSIGSGTAGCSTAYVINSRDNSNTLTTPPTPVPLTATGSTGIRFYTDSTCATALSVSGNTSNLNLSSSTTNIYVKDSVGTLNAAQTFTISGLGVPTSASSSQTLTVGASQLAFTGTPQTVGAGVCSNAVTINLTDAAGNSANAASSTTINLSGSGFTFYASTDSNCTGSTVTSTTASAGASSAQFKFVYSSNNANKTITANATFSASDENASVTATAVTEVESIGANTVSLTGFPTGIMAYVSGTIGCGSGTVQAQLYGTGSATNILGGTSLTVPINFTGTSASSGGLYSDSSCSTTLPSSSVTIASGNSSAIFYFKSTFGGTATFSLGTPSLSYVSVTGSSQNVTIGASTMVLSPSSTTLTAGSAGGGICQSMTLTTKDSLANATNPYTSVTAALAASGAGTAKFWTDTACSAGQASSLNLSLTNAASSYTFSVSDTKAESMTVTASSASLSSGTANFTINPAGADHLAFTTWPSPTPSAGPNNIPAFTVKVLDAFNNTITTGTGYNSSITVAISASGGTTPTLTGTTNLTATSGVANFSALGVTLAGTNGTASPYTYTLTATSSPSYTSSTTIPFTVKAASPASLAFSTQPGSGATIADNSNIPIGVTFHDQYGNIAANPSTTVTLTKASGTGSIYVSGSANSAPTAASDTTTGIATFSGITINPSPVPGAITLQAAAGGMTSITSNSFNMAVGSPDHLTFSTQPVSTTANTTLSNVIVQVRDIYNLLTSTLSTGTVTVAIASGPGSFFSGTTTQNITSGQATFNDLKIRTAGAYTMGATSSPSYTSTTSSSFSISPANANATNSTFTINPTNSYYGVTNPIPANGTDTFTLNVTLKDAYGNTIPSVTPTVNKSGPGTLTCSATTAANGTTTCTFSSGTVGQQTITLTNNGMSLASSTNPVFYGLRLSVDTGNSTYNTNYAEYNFSDQDSFGSSVTDGSVVDHVYYLTNLTGSAITPTFSFIGAGASQFQVTTNNCSGGVSANGHCSFTIRYTASNTPGTESDAEIQVTGSDSAYDVIQSYITGTSQ